MSTAIAVAATLLTIICLDLPWLMLVAIGHFQTQLGPILNAQPNMLAAAAFYVIFAGGLFHLAVRPAMQKASIGTALGNGAMVGLTAYATFDLTSLAIIKGWTVGLALLDMAWGTAMSAVAAASGYCFGMRSRVT